MFLHLNDENFDDFVLSSSKPSLVDFTASWCGSCQRVYPVIEEVALKYGDSINVCLADIDVAEKAAERYHISTLPSILVFREGQVAVRVSGEIDRDRILGEIGSSLS